MAPFSSPAGRAVLLEAGSAPFDQVHRLIERGRAEAAELLVRGEAVERVARLLGPSREGLLRLRGARSGGRGLDGALRALDLALGSLLLLALLPVMAAIAVAVKATSPGPVCHRSRVVGRGGATFVWRKFRTMRAGAGDARHREAARRFIAGEDLEFRAAGVYKMQDDDRITSVGRLLRRHSLDELPQLFDVLLGRMSLVGPRPCLPYEWALYAPHQRRRLDVKPGMTGLWQALGRSRVGFEEMVLMDRCWAWNRSVRLYLWILARTLRVVATGEGGY